MSGGNYKLKQGSLAIKYNPWKHSLAYNILGITKQIIRSLNVILIKKTIQFEVMKIKKKYTVPLWPNGPY